MMKRKQMSSEKVDLTGTRNREEEKTVPKNESISIDKQSTQKSVDTDVDAFTNLTSEVKHSK